MLMAPVVLTEVLSDPKLPAEVSQTLSELPLIEVTAGHWQQAGELRAKVLAKRRKARLGNALIARVVSIAGFRCSRRKGFPGIRRRCRARSSDCARSALNRSPPAAGISVPPTACWEQRTSFWATSRTVERFEAEGAKPTMNGADST